MFVNRQQAGIMLAEKVLKELKGDPDFRADSAVVIGLPRGGVPVALEIALAMRCPLDILVSKKMGAPDNPELAIGAVSSDGVVVTDEKLMQFLAVPKQFVESQRQRLINDTKALERTWVNLAGLQARATVKGKWVIVVDDGIATGMTALAALRTLQMRAVGSLILATPVMSYDAYHQLRDECDRVVALLIPHDFASVGQYYHDFHQVDNNELVAAMQKTLQPAQPTEHS
ncbi:MAG: phosphoribosyltransferase [Candidatus Melainabacteria bacterium]|nr:phosphoribosyltransferase [Candidatus Melainabacteria bacterium]